MGSLVGHVVPGLAFFVLGLWHLFNHTKLHALKPNSYTSSPWFPTSKFRYLELFFIMIGSSISISMELFIGPLRHQPFDPDGTIPSNHLHNFEHSSISTTFFVYAAFAMLLDIIIITRTKDHHHLHHHQCGLSFTLLLASVAFAQQLFLFHVHSTDHKGVEGQYHWLLQMLIAVSLATTLTGIGFPSSFLVSFVRSLSIFSQGVWFIIMGYMLWTPALIPKGCFLHLEEKHHIVRCANIEALHRARSLANIQFSWFIIGITIFAVSFYLAMVQMYSSQDEIKYLALAKDVAEEVEAGSNNVELQKRDKFGDFMSSRGFAQPEMEKQKM